jgi:endonuclease III
MARATRSSAANDPPTNKDMHSNMTLQQLSSPTAAPAPAKKAATKAKSIPKVKKEAPSTPANSGRKRGNKRIKREDEDEDVNALPHNLGTALPTPGADDEGDSAPPKKRTRKSAKTETKTETNHQDDATDVQLEADEKATPQKSPKKKANYGLTPGISPFPDYARPSPEECKEVTRLLEKVHGEVHAPKVIPPPSLDVAGCGEVPSVLDALIRTRLSANTTNGNSATAFRGLVSKFGTIKDGIGKGSVNWNAVRIAPFDDVFEAIRAGGLANVKGKDIQKILQMTWEENQERSALLISQNGDPAGAEHEPGREKNSEVEKAAQNVLSLDHIHLLDTNAAINEMLKFPGIGPKTASCVALFCLQRPSFAVDTHVFRLCQYLGWVPKTTPKGKPKVNRETTYSHCDVRIPDEYKYPLHQLLIKHGKVCPRCRAITGQNSADWEKGCPLEHLVKRHGAKKGGISTNDRKKSKSAAGVDSELEGEDWELLDAKDGEAEAEADQDSELSDLESDGE